MEIIKQLWDLPLPDRLSVLTLSIFERERGRRAVCAVDGMIDVIDEALKRFPVARLPVDDRFRLADKLRDIKDTLECRQSTTKVKIH